MQEQFFEVIVFHLIEQILLKDKTPFSLKRQDRLFTSVEIGTRNCLIFPRTITLKYGG